MSGAVNISGSIRHPAAVMFLPVAVCYLFLGCASNKIPDAADSVRIPVAFSGLVHAGQTNSQEEYALINKMEAHWLLATFYWSRIEPADDQWNFDSYDTYVDTALAAGKQIIGVLAYDVPWIHGDNDTHRYIPPDKMDFYCDFVRQTAEHFRGRVDAWCIWNEPNGHFWKGTKNEFFMLSRKAAFALREADPDVVILGGAFNRSIAGLPKAYIKGLFESGAMEKADAVAFHPYELNPARTVKLYRAFKALVAGYGFDNRIWVTEVGYPTGGWYPTATSEKKFPAFIVKTFVNLPAAGSQKVVWYQLFDPEIRKKINSEDFFGLVRSKVDYTSKGAEAFRLCAQFLPGTLYHPDLPLREGLPKSLQTFFFDRPGGGVLVLWKEGKPFSLEVQIPGSGYLHDPVSCKAMELNGTTIITVGSSPIFVTWQETADFISQTAIPVKLTHIR